MRVIFLDMDGVMNSSAFFRGRDDRENSLQEMLGEGKLGFGAAQIDPAAVSILNKIVEDADAHVVISSSWRHIWTHREIAEMLASRGFEHPDRVIDVTPQGFGNRGEEVRAWLELDGERRTVDPGRSPVTSYVIIDDVDQFAGETREHLVRTDPQRGLSPADASHALGILAQEG